MTTTVQVSDETQKRLEEAKDHPRETFDEVIIELLDEREARLKKKIERAKKQEGVPQEEVKELLGL
ncbi:MAG: antitoxin VapB family protein [Candidatus Nanohaloarchaea archaeon]|nr:antitoxin VapB family protein [Candidatus Nanohaloarchaea archaeon]